MDRSSLARQLLHHTQLRQQTQHDYVLTGISPFDQVLGGLPRGSVTEIYGPATSGKTTFLHCLLSRATARGEFCALVDGADSFDPASAAKANADLARLLWVRCRGVEQALKSADLLVHSGGWGLVALDLGEIAANTVRRIPMSWWYRFRRAVEHTPTVFIVLEREPFVKSCATFGLGFSQSKAIWSGTHEHFRILRGMDIRISPRKPFGAKDTTFRSEFV